MLYNLVNRKKSILLVVMVKVTKLIFLTSDLTLKKMYLP